MTRWMTRRRGSITKTISKSTTEYSRDKHGRRPRDVDSYRIQERMIIVSGRGTCLCEKVARS